MTQKFYTYGGIGLTVIIAFFALRGCEPEPLPQPSKPTIITDVKRHTDTVVRVIEVVNRIYIPVSEPTLNTKERAVLDTVIKRDSSTANLHVEYNKQEEQFENVMAAFTVPVRVEEKTNYIDREVKIEIPVPTPAPPDDDDLGWFGLGGLVGVLVTVIGALAL